MRLVRRPEFLALPAGTVFANHNPISALEIKGDTWEPNDFIYESFDTVEASGTKELAELEVAMSKDSTLSVPIKKRREQRRLL